MLDQIHLLSAVTVLGVLEQGRDHGTHMPQILSGLVSSISSDFISPLYFICAVGLLCFSDSGLIPCQCSEKYSTNLISHAV